MYKAYCRTNLDSHRFEQWPDRFVQIPKVGDYIQSKSGKRLKVCMITHSMNFETQQPLISIELHH